MISQLVIKNFKSIKQVDIPCKKLNVFIGEPNGGKSNIIEALSLMSEGIITTLSDSPIEQELSKEIFRYKSMTDLFFDFNINDPVEVKTNLMSCKLKYIFNKNGLPNEFQLQINNSNVKNQTSNFLLRIGIPGYLLDFPQPFSTNFRYYQYKRINEFIEGSLSTLSSPFGENLANLLRSNPEYRNWVTELFGTKGFHLNVIQGEVDIAMSKIVDKSVYTYNYQAISETLQRIVFYIIAIKSNKNAVLLFDEPETNTFPFYTKFLAERIALDESNQFFLTTHNPYLLLSLIEKSKVDDLNVCVVRMKDYETKVTPLNKEQLTEVLDFNSDVFLNLDRIVD